MPFSSTQGTASLAGTDNSRTTAYLEKKKQKRKKAAVKDLLKDVLIAVFFF